MMLGNLSLDHIQKRVGVIFPDSLISFMEPKNQANAKNIQSGYWHCFDIPFMLVCGDVDTAIEIFDHFKAVD